MSADYEEKIKDYFADKGDKVAEKIEKTPMQRFFVFFLILITVSAGFLAYLQFKSNIESPFRENKLRREKGELTLKYQSQIPEADQDVLQLQLQDSDLDGLDDYSELNVYGTSPYLEDTDSDGIWDKQEILNGQDPLCPQGQDCYSAGTKPDPLSQIGVPSDDFSYEDLGINDMLSLESELLSGEVDLSSLGIDSPELQQMFDQLQSFKNVGVSQLPAEQTNQAINQLQQMQPDQIRAQLLSQGMDEALLQQIDDEMLKQVFDDLLLQYQPAEQNTEQPAQTNQE